MRFDKKAPRPGQIYCRIMTFAESILFYGRIDKGLCNYELAGFVTLFNAYTAVKIMPQSYFVSEIL